MLSILELQELRGLCLVLRRYLQDVMLGYLAVGWRWPVRHETCLGCRA